ncbi:tyrosine-type recombinase/integrase [Lampropedia puyangensis]
MSRKELAAQQVAMIGRRGINFVGGVTGLALNVTMYGSRSWVLRFQVAGKRRDFGLGSYPSVTLAEAKEAARRARAKLAQGIDPIEDARKAREQLAHQMHTSMTFGEAAKRYISAHEKSWKSPKHAQQWRNTLDTYASTVLGKVAVRDITVAMVLRVLEPIWSSKTETATRLRGRVESIIDWAIARGYRTDANPARWKGLLDKLLPAPGKVTKTVHHKAMPYSQLPGFMTELLQQDSMGAKALAFVILTATRSGEVRNATWDEFDLEERVWTIPAERMKASKAHRVPLSDAAMDLLLALPRKPSPRAYVFHSPLSRNAEKGSPLSDMTLTALLRRLKVDAVPHGFRSTFRDWCAEQTDHANEVAEMALAHTVANKVEAAYRRGDLFAKRIALMSDWAAFALQANRK